MKKLGLIGGTGPESTLIYYREINRLVLEKTDGKMYPEFSLENISLTRALGYCKTKDYAGLTKYLLTALQNLKNAGAECATLTANTLHIVFDTLQEKSPLPLVSILDATCAEVLKQGYKSPGLLGTIFTMQEPFFTKPFLAAGIPIATPSGHALQDVNLIITDELELGIVKPESVARLIEVINQMQSDNGIDSIILGCTELPLAISPKNSPLPVIDTMQIHIKTLADIICS